ncbi:MAG: Fic family protein [Acidobacteria bacterium]|nr:Fic family protein [Acidobacteriota bacterium]
MGEQPFIAGTYSQQYQYKSFLPSSLNKSAIAWHNLGLDLLLEDATRLLGELNAYSHLVPDVDFFIRMHIYKEATASSRIEGTQTKFDEALLDIEEIAPERRDDWNEVQNYTAAMNFAIKELEHLPLSMRLLNETHRILMQGVRGQNRGPGEIRRTQNWIGGASIKDAYFVPPSPEELPELLSDLEKFWHNETLNYPHLIKIGLSHYQFETIHPYLDGNGRTGRLLITLYLVEKGLLRRPTLYLSDFFERNRPAYYNALTVIRTQNDIGHWLKFFLVGVAQTAEQSKRTFEEIIRLRSECEQKAMLMGKRARKALQLLTSLYSQPIVSASAIAALLDITSQSANALARAFEDAGILLETTGYKRNRLFAFKDYIELFQKRDLSDDQNDLHVPA